MLEKMKVKSCLKYLGKLLDPEETLIIQTMGKKKAVTGGQGQKRQKDNSLGYI